MWEGVPGYLGCGVLAGIAAGMFGVGGGIVVVPFLAWQFPAQGFPDRLAMLMAVATSLATIVVTSMSSVVAHHRLGTIRWEVVRRLVPGIAAGALAGAVIAERLPVPLFKLMFGAFLALVAQRLLFRGGQTSMQHNAAPKPGFAVAGSLIGLFSAILGIGGGTLSVPYLLRHGVPIRNAIAVSSACGFPIAVVGTAAYLVLGWHQPNLPPLSAGYVSLPAFLTISVSSVPFAPVGARLACLLPGTFLRRGFALVLCGVGVRLFWQGFAML